MKSHWTLSVLLSSALVVGCGGSGTDNSQDIEENSVTPGAPGVAQERSAAEPAPAARGDTSAVTRRSATLAPADVDRVNDLQTRPSTSSTSRSRLPEFREVTVPAGTALPLELLTALSSETARVETPVRARLSQALVVDGYTVMPAGAVLTGTVTDVDRAGRVQGRSRLAFVFNEAEVNGGREDLRTNPLAFEGEATKGEDATKIGAGAGVGAIIGGILGGGDGAAKGAAIGGAAGTGVVLGTRGKEVTLAAGTDLAASLAEPLTLRVSTR